jgi:hypothetical protein
MSRLIRLYPAAWRARYAAELVDLLAERPVTLTDRIDLARGAIDAHVHPQLGDRLPQPWTHRLPGLLASVAGLLWSWSFAELAFRADPEQDWGSGFGIAFLIMIVSLPGDYLAGRGRQIAIGIGIAVAGLILGRLLPWSVGDGLLNVVAGGVTYLGIVGAMLTLAAIRTGIGARGRWVMLVAAVVAPAIVSIPLILGLAAYGAGFALVFALLVPYGIAWALVGMRMTFRGSRTLVDPPNQTGPLVEAA